MLIRVETKMGLGVGVGFAVVGRRVVFGFPFFVLMVTFPREGE